MGSFVRPSHPDIMSQVRSLALKCGVSPVFPCGKVGANLMVVGFRPNDAGSVPFSGPSHQIWRDMLMRFGVSNDLVWQTYLYKAEPVDLDSVDVRKQWMDVFLHEVNIVKPKSILLLGELVASHIMGYNAVRPIDEYRCKLWRVEDVGQVPVFVTHSVESAISSDNLSIRHEIVEDFVAVAFADPDHFVTEMRVGKNAKGR